MGHPEYSLNVQSNVLKQNRDVVDSLVSRTVNRASGVNSGKEMQYILPSFTDICNENIDIRKAYEYQYKSRFPTTGRVGKGPEEELSDDMIAYQGMAIDSPFYGYNLTTGAFDLYIANPEHLATIPGGDKFAVGKNFELLQQGIVNAMRIDVSYTDVHGGHSAKATRLINASSGDKRLNINNFVFVPAFVVNRLILMLTEFMRKGRVVKIVLDNNGSLKEHYVSMNPKVLEAYNGHTNALEYVDFRYTGRFYVPVVGAPVYSSGITAIDVSKLDEVTITRQGDIDVHPANNDPKELVRSEIFMLFLTLLFTEEFESKRYKFWELIQMLGGIVSFDENMYSYMRAIRSLGQEQRDALWNKLPSDFQAYEENMNNVVRGYEPYTGEMTVSALRRAMKNGVYKVVSMRKSGSFSSIICTNNDQMLKIAYGEDYAKRYESDNYRLGRFYEDVNNGVPEVEAMKTWNMLDASYVKEAYDTETSDEAALADALYKLAEHNSSQFETRIDEDRDYNTQETEFKVRALFNESMNGGSFYRTLYPDRIFQIIRVG